MTWVRIDDRAPTHPKVRDVGPEAAWLWLCGLCWCNGHHTDGTIREQDLDALSPGTWTGKQLKRLVSRLVSAGMWIKRGRGYVVHDYSEYQGEAMREAVDERRAYERERKRAQRAAKKAAKNAQSPPMSRRDSPGHVPGTEPGQPVGTGAGQAQGTPAGHGNTGPSTLSQPPGPARPGPSREKKKSASLSPRDPMRPAAEHPGVAELHEAWKTACGFPAHRFRGAYDADAGILADAIRAYGLTDCLAVADHAPNDGMVSGKRDERGAKHDTIRYIFGNADAFNRILRAAQERAGKSTRKRSAAELVEEARRL